jgi:hypothetical protein
VPATEAGQPTFLTSAADTVARSNAHVEGSGSDKLRINLSPWVLAIDELSRPAGSGTRELDRVLVVSCRATTEFRRVSSAWMAQQESAGAQQIGKGWARTAEGARAAVGLAPGTIAANPAK